MIFVVFITLAHLVTSIPTNDGAESRLGWTKIKQMYNNLHPRQPHSGAIVRTHLNGCAKESVGQHG